MTVLGLGVAPHEINLMNQLEQKRNNPSTITMPNSRSVAMMARLCSKALPKSMGTEREGTLHKLPSRGRWRRWITTTGQMWVQVTEMRKSWVFLAVTHKDIVMFAGMEVVWAERGTLGRMTCLARAVRGGSEWAEMDGLVWEEMMHDLGPFSIKHLWEESLFSRDFGS